MKRYIKSSTTPSGIPEARPTKAELLKDAKALRGKDLLDAITILDSFGDWYREDKREKRKYLESVIDLNYVDDPATTWDIADAIETNNKLLYTVYGISPYSTEFSKRFGRYDIDILYDRRAKS